MKKIMIAIVLMTLVFSLASTMTVSGDGPNYMGFTMANNHVTVTDSLTIDAYVQVASSIDTASIDNMTFLSAGIVNYTSTTQGNLFPSGTIVWMTPESSGVINNISGWARPITWSSMNPVNGVTRNLAIISMYAHGCGVATLTITAGGTALSGLDPGTTKIPYAIYVHPKVTTGFTATGVNESQINLSWTKTEGIDKTLIRFRADMFPTSVTDGSELYNGTDSSTSHGGLNPGDHFYYSAWGWSNGGLYSLTYQSDDAQTSGGNVAPDEPELWLPHNNSLYLSVYNEIFKANVSDSNGDLMTVDFYWGNDTLFNTQGSIPNGTVQIAVADFQSPSWKDWLEHDTTYSWYVTVNDSVYMMESDMWLFHTSKAWDLNEDTHVNYLDISIMVANYLNNPPHPGQYSWDVNNDGLSNYLDLSSIVYHYLENY